MGEGNSNHKNIYHKSHCPYLGRVKKQTFSILGVKNRAFPHLIVKQFHLHSLRFFICKMELRQGHFNTYIGIHFLLGNR